jgi:hypothetical protein
MSGLQVSRAFDPARWDELSPAAAVHSSRWLNVMLSRLPGEPLMVVCDGPGGAVGFTGAVVTEPDAYEAYNPWLILRGPRPVFEEVHAKGRAAPRIGDAPGELLPGAVLTAPGYIGDPAGPGAGDQEAVRRCLAGVCEWARQQGLATVSLLYTTRYAGAAVEAAVTRLGGDSFDLTSRGVLRVTWTDWAGRLAALPRRRKEIARQLRRLDDAGCTVSPMDPRPVIDEVVAARCALLAWYEQPYDYGREQQRLRSLLSSFGPDAALFTTARSGKIIACALFVAHGRTLQNVYAGTTPQGRETPYAHLAATYYAPAAYASADRFDVIDYSIGHAETKRFQGCEFTPMRGHVISLRQG